MNRLTDEQMDKIIKDKFKQDNTISKQADIAFRNFNPNVINKANAYNNINTVNNTKVDETNSRANVYQMKKSYNFYNYLSRVLGVAAVSLTVLLVGGTALYLSKNDTPEQVITYKQSIVKNEKLNVSNEVIVKEVENEFVKVYLTGKKDVGVNLTSTYWDEFDGEFTSTDCYKIDNIDKSVADIFIGEIGGHGLPYVFLLMEDGTIEYVDLHCFYDNSFYYEAKVLEGLDDVVGFEQKTRKFSYSNTDYEYVNAIRKDGLRKEIQIGVVNNWTDTADNYDVLNEKYIKAHNGEAIIDDGKGDYTVDGITYLHINGEDKYAYYKKDDAFYRVERSTAKVECMATGCSGFARDNADGRLSVSLSDGYKVFILDKNIIFKNRNDGIINEITANENTTINENQTNENNEQQVSQNIQTGSANITVLKGNSYKTEIITDAESNTREIYTVTFDEEGKPTIKVGYKNPNMTEVYFETTEIYNVVGDAGAGSVYVDFDFKAFTPGGEITGSGSIRYSNVTDNEQIGVKAHLDIEGNLKDFNNNGDYIYVTKIAE